MISSRAHVKLTLNTVAKILIQNLKFSSSPEYRHYLDVTIDQLEPEYYEQLKRVSARIRDRTQRTVAEKVLAKSLLGPELANKIVWDGVALKYSLCIY